MFLRIAAVVLVASSFLSGAIAEPIPVPVPVPTLAPDLAERDIFDSVKSLVSEGTRIFADVTSAAGSIATLVTSVGGEAVTLINDISGSVHEIAGNGVDSKFVTVTSIGGQAYTIVKDEFVKVKPTSTPTPAKNAASPLRPIVISLPITVSLVSTILAVGLGAQFVL